MTAKRALIAGGSLVAVQAALDLADSGIPVTLAESSPFLGDRPGGFPGFGNHSARLLEAVKHPNIKVMTCTQVTAVHGRKGDFQVQLERTPRYVDWAKCTACGDCVPVCPVTVPVDGQPRTAIFGGGEGAVPNVFAIEKRGVAPCKATCPGGIHVQGYVALIAQRRFQEALDLIREAIPLPGVLGRICYHPCEDACRRGSEVDEAVSICALKRFVADDEFERRGRPQLPPTAFDPTLGRVAIIGAGPAGLTVAYFLARAGVCCEVFEALPVAGGMLAVGIPDYRLPPAVLWQEIAAIEEMGVPIHLNHPVDETEWARLQAEYDAIFVGVGAHRPRRLQIPGDELEGVIPGVELLRQVNLAGARNGKSQTCPAYPAVGEHVVVIGGGNTAIDAAMVSLRLGAKQATVLYRRSRPEMLANPWEIAEAEDEGVAFHFLASPVRAIGKDGRLVALECVRNQLGEPDQSGRRRPVPIPGSEFVISCDTLLPAIGQAVSCTFPELESSRWGSIQVDPLTLQTSLPNVFAGGDAVIGPASVIESIGDGRRAVESILRFLRGEELASERTAERPDVAEYDYYTPAEPVIRARAHAARAHVPREARRSFAEVALGLSAEQAVAEAQRCLACGVCSECLACVAVCEPAAINHDQIAVRYTLDASVIIWADVAGPPLPVTRGNIYELHGHDPLVASAVAAQAMADLAGYRSKRPLPYLQATRADEPRVGVFVCRCGERIAGVLDVAGLVQSAGALPAVAHAQQIPFACQPEGAEAIRRAMIEQALNQVVLAACSCCSLDQVCDSCTYQRVRCKRNLLSVPIDLMNLPAEFVNIREQCAWAHRDDPALGTDKARRLIAAAVAKSRLLNPALNAPRMVTELAARVLVAGESEAADICADALQAQYFGVTRSPQIPTAIEGSLGRFRVQRNGVGLEVSAVVLAPADVRQLPPTFQALPDRVATPEPGLFVCPPAGDPELVGAAVAAKVGAALGGGRIVASYNIARVNQARCRACGTCQAVCEHHAIQVGEASGRAVALVDPALCLGCGVCTAHCPSSAITAGDTTDAQIEAMLEAILSE